MADYGFRNYRLEDALREREDFDRAVKNIKETATALKVLQSLGVVVGDFDSDAYNRMVDEFKTEKENLDKKVREAGGW